MTCKECLYYEACEHYNNGDAAELSENAVETKCPIFKDKSRYIETPCKVGEIVYSITEASCENIDGVHTECEFYGYGIDDRICFIPNGAKCPYQYRIIKCYVTESNILMFAREWNKTVFLAREEAEKALAERNNR